MQYRSFPETNVLVQVANYVSFSHNTTNSTHCVSFFKLESVRSSVLELRLLFGSSSVT